MSKQLLKGYLVQLTTVKDYMFLEHYLKQNGNFERLFTHESYEANSNYTEIVTHIVEQNIKYVFVDETYCKIALAGTTQNPMGNLASKVQVADKIVSAERLLYFFRTGLWVEVDKAQTNAVQEPYPINVLHLVFSEDVNQIFDDATLNKISETICNLFEKSDIPHKQDVLAMWQSNKTTEQYCTENNLSVQELKLATLLILRYLRNPCQSKALRKFTKR